jgi:hypothetical protein
MGYTSTDASGLYLSFYLSLYLLYLSIYLSIYLFDFKDEKSSSRKMETSLDEKKPATREYAYIIDVILF